MALARAAVAVNNLLKAEKNLKTHEAPVVGHRPMVPGPDDVFSRCTMMILRMAVVLRAEWRWSIAICLTISCLHLVVAPREGRGQVPSARAVRAIQISPFSQSLAQPVAESEEVMLADQVSAGEPTEPPNGGAAEKPKEDLEQKRLEKIGQLIFDRRPTAILKAWSTPPEASTSAADENQGNHPSKAQAQADAADQETPEAKAAREAQEAEMAFDLALKEFQRNVTLGEWELVAEFLKVLPEQQGNAAYAKLLQSLADGPGEGINPEVPLVALPEEVLQALVSASARRGNQNEPFQERNEFSFDDLIGLIDAAPAAIEKSQLKPLGAILSQTLAAGHDLPSFLNRVRPRLVDEVADGDSSPEGPPSKRFLTRRELALVLFAAQQDLSASEFLPTVEQAIADDDREGLNLISRHSLAMYRKERQVKDLESAWNATQAALASGEVEVVSKREALQRAVELAPQVREELGETWLEESFQKRKERGREILATIGANASLNRQTHPFEAPLRHKTLQLQQTAVESLLAAAPETAADWQDQLEVLAGNWLREAQFAYQHADYSDTGPQLRRDNFGNLYYFDSREEYYGRGQTNQGQAIAPADLLKLRPSDAWLALLDKAYRPRYDIMLAQLHLKVNEEEQAFPFIEKFAESNPDQALELAHEFLRVWTNNHNPNVSRDRTNYYMFMYGYDQRADRIPLTRSKQERNLKDLAGWVERLRALPIGDLDETLLVRAFTSSHSTAEVYRLESLERVFGDIGKLEPDTVAEMIQQMRGSLAGIWRDPAEQKNKQTNRRKKDLEAEILRGYRVADEVLDNALQQHPESWQLRLAEACLEFDFNDYQHELENRNDYSQRRQQSMQQFAEAAAMYAKTLPELKVDEETTNAYELWFYAGLGAVDLAKLDKDTQPDLRQPALIRAALEALPGAAAERHLGQFANRLFTRLSAIKPEMKTRYLNAGFEIVADHPQAIEARKVFDYYQDLVTEIRFETRVDGSDVVGHERPFGVFVNLVHTKEIERESGGFGKYLQNQNNMYYAYNYGRPTENYRDKFQEAATAALQEHFEVLSITFNQPDSQSKALTEYGWRYTPYAYLLLKARGPEVDKLPPLQIDLDFLDTSGYAIIPIESPALPIDARPEAGEARPWSKLDVVQILDERQAADGKLILEVKATARGLVPDLKEVLDLSPSEFTVSSIEDAGLAVSRFDEESEADVVISERSWMVAMQAKPDLATPPRQFEFAQPLDDQLVEVSYQRYVDADLLDVESTIDLEQRYARADYTQWIVWGAVALVGCLALAAIVWVWRRRPKEVDQARFKMPADLTPFTVLGLLKRIENNNGLNTDQLKQLRTTIDRLEHHYFERAGESDPNLEEIAHEWIRVAR